MLKLAPMSHEEQVVSIVERSQPGTTSAIHVRRSEASAFRTEHIQLCLTVVFRDFGKGMKWKPSNLAIFLRQETYGLRTTQVWHVLKLRSHQRPSMIVTSANLYSRRKTALSTDKP